MRQALTLFSLFIFSPLPLEASNDSFGEAYQSIGAPGKYKKVFEETLVPKIRANNAKIRSERAFIKRFFSRFIFTYSAFDRTKVIKLNRLAKKYKIKHLYDEQAYLAKIDVVPISLALAQAAIESAWGKSRFSKEANNIFGEWTYGKEGLVPEERVEGMNHKIKIFKDLDASIYSYMRNLNRNPAYKDFRKKRALYRNKWQGFGGLEAADTLDKYSGIGKEYCEIIKKTITQNAWQKYD